MRLAWLQCCLNASCLLFAHESNLIRTELDAGDEIRVAGLGAWSWALTTSRGTLASERSRAAGKSDLDPHAQVGNRVLIEYECDSNSETVAVALLAQNRPGRRGRQSASSVFEVKCLRLWAGASWRGLESTVSLLLFGGWPPALRSPEVGATWGDRGATQGVIEERSGTS